MEISGIIIGILWTIISLLAMIQYAPACKDLSWQDQLFVGIIFIIGSPILAAASILEAILECILPGGLGDDNGPWQY